MLGKKGIIKMDEDLIRETITKIQSYSLAQGEEELRELLQSETKKAEVRGRIDENRWAHALFGTLNRPKLDKRLAELQSGGEG